MGVPAKVREMKLRELLHPWARAIHCIGRARPVGRPAAAQFLFVFAEPTDGCPRKSLGGWSATRKRSQRPLGRMAEYRKLTDGPTTEAGQPPRYIPLTISIALCIWGSFPAIRSAGDNSTEILGVTPLPSINLPRHVRYAATGKPSM